MQKRRSGRPRAAAAGCMAVGVALALAACGSSGTQASGSASGKCTIEYIPKNTGNPYFTPIEQSMKTAAAKFGYTVTVEAPSTAGSTLQIPYIESATAKHNCGIGISPNDPNTEVPSLKQAMAQGAAVLSIDEDMNHKGRDAAVMPAPFPQIGAAQVALMGQLMDYSGQFAILSATTTAPDQNFWIQGMKAALKEPKYKNMHLVKVAYGNDDPSTSTTQTEALISAYPDLKGILSPTTVGVAAAANVVQQKGLCSKIAVTGLGDPEQMKTYVTSGCVKSFQLWDSSKEGSVAAYLFHAMIADHFKPTPGKSFNAGPSGTLTLNSDDEVAASPILTFTASNINKYDF